MPSQSNICIMLPVPTICLLIFSCAFILAITATGGATTTTNIKELCSQRALRALASGVDEDDVPADNKSFWSKFSSRIPTSSAATKSHKQSPRRAYAEKDAIRFALRKYFCDQLLLNDDAEEWQNAGVKFVGNEKWLETVLQWDNSNGNGGNHQQQQLAIPVARMERTFKKNDPAMPHAFASDFRFRAFFPEEFARLWQTFGLRGAAELLDELTRGELNDFDNPAVSPSTFYTSRGDKYFLKSLQTVRNPEANFFFKRTTTTTKSTKSPSEEEEVEYLHWSPSERADSRQFNGAFQDYYGEMRSRGRGHHASLLAKYVLLFSFEPFNSDDVVGTAAASKIFVVMSNVFPTPPQLPTIDYKFDLKGASVKRELGMEKGVAMLAAGGMMPTWRDVDMIRHQHLMPLSRGEQHAVQQPTTAEGLFPNGIELASGEWNRLNATLQRDTDFLLAHNIMDYSLLLGIHFVDNNRKQSTRKIVNQLLSNNNNSGGGAGGISEMPAKCTMCSKFGAATNSAKNKKINGRHQLLLFLGIIDILTPFGAEKQQRGDALRLKNTESGNTVNTCFPATHPCTYDPMSNLEPAKYQERFLDFLLHIVFHLPSQQ